MRKQHNLKATSACFYRKQEEVSTPTRTLPQVEHVYTRRQVLADVADFEAASTLVSKHTGAVPVFHVVRPSVCLDFCLHGVLGERISS